MNNDKVQETRIPEALPQGTKIGQDYTILRVLGQGGFGITYLAHDEMIGGEIVIKENMPADFAARDRDTLRLSPRPRQEENYTWARERFLDEARLLHKLHHPNIVPVTRAFAALNTAYYVMPHVGATELGDAVRNAPNGRSEAYLAPLLRQLLDALTYLHGKDLLHRDLKPSNILMSEKGVPVIIDFGSARATVSGRTHTMLESPGYTPIEQLKQHGKVGPWTDLYSLGATFYRLITGNVPPRSIDRMDEDDPYEPLAARADLQQRFSRRFLAGIDKALEVRIKHRWQTAADWANDLPAPQPATQKTDKKIKGENTHPVPPSPAPAPNKLWVGISMFSTLLVLVLAGYIFLTQQQEPKTTETPQRQEPKTTTTGTPQQQEPKTTTTETPQRQDPQTTTTETPQQQDPKTTTTGTPQQQDPQTTTKGTPQRQDPQTTTKETPQQQDPKTTTTGTPQQQEPRTTTTNTPQTPVVPTTPRTLTAKVIKEIRHDNSVTSVAFSPDGNFLAIGCWNCTAYINKVATGDLIKKFDHVAEVSGVAFSPDGKFLATACYWDETVRIINISTGDNFRAIKHASTSVAFSPVLNSRYVATGCGDGTVLITHVDTGKTIRKIKRNDWVRSVAFSPDGKFLATGGFDKTARITEVATGRTVQEIKHDDSVNSVAFSPDGRFLATGSDSTALITEVASGRTIQEIKHNTPVADVAFSPDGRFLATGNWDDTARITEVATGRTVQVIKHGSTVNSVAFSPDGKFLATGSSDKTARIYELKETAE